MQITYNHGEIDALVADVKGVIGKIQAHLEELQHDVDPLIQQAEGQEASAYQEYQKAWHQSADDLNQILTQLNSKVDQGNQDAISTDNSAAGAWG
ncbi:ESAT-6-like protein [Mycobacteroides stephanolepidis]|uniref:ESAT-6-like protein n=1 Tax=[Mycobacterium] stephanolepidis TaxID=1520670 RepID=A0A1Z4F1V7_9MYCO|nr:WXG100 family type VII secretion target [[Mycobacterium] stephanolepidis]BAX99200.1 ESAT-6-like protein [[Mycobacterium] stephanolepidis]